MAYAARSFRKKLSDDVDIQTLYSMRREGMSNKQIADSLGVSVSTIYNYIGRKSDAVKVAYMQGQPAGSVIPIQPWEEKEKPVAVETITAPEETAQPTVIEEPVMDCQPEEHAEEPQRSNEEMPREERKSTALRVVSTRSTLQGLLCKYVVDTDSDSIEIDGGAVLSGLLDKENLVALVDELNQIVAMFN